MRHPWLWNINKTEAEVKRILRDPGQEAFVHYAALLLSRHPGLPKEIFRDYLRKEDFCRRWPAIKRRMRKNDWNDRRILFWDGAYKFLLSEFRKQGVTFPREKKPVVRDPGREKAAREVREMRRARNMTQVELARRLGVKQQFISKVESGTQNLSLSTLEKIRRCLGPVPASYEYSTDDTLPRADRVTEQGLSPAVARPAVVTTWLDPDPGRRTHSR